MMPLVSVVIPLYNKRLYIARAVESVCQQTFTSWELIIVDDGSTDGSLDLARSFARDQIRVVWQDNQGPGAARNRGMAEAQAPFVTFLDADDTIDPDFLTAGLRALTVSWPEAASWTCGYLLYPEKSSQEALWRKRGIKQGQQDVSTSQSVALFAHQLAFMHCTTLARRGVLLKYGGFFADYRCIYGEDAFLWLHLLLNEQVVFSYEPLFHYHRDASELSADSGRARPIEPFLLYPELVRARCPEELRPLLEKFLSLRAFKTASTLGYWGRWREAAHLRESFRRPGDWSLPNALAAALGSTPVGGWVGALHRVVSGRGAPPGE